MSTESHKAIFLFHIHLLLYMYNDFHDQINYSQILPSVLLVSILQQCSKEVISDTGLKSIQPLWETKQQLCRFNNNSFNSTILYLNILDLTDL